MTGSVHLHAPNKRTDAILSSNARISEQELLAILSAFRAGAPMHLLSSSETSALSGKFSRLLRIGLVGGALAVGAWMVMSIFDDRSELEAQVEQSELAFAASLRIHVDQVLDQAVFSLRGVRSDLSDDIRYARGTRSPIADDVLKLLRNAMRFDPVSAVLFVREGDGVVHAVDSDGQTVPEVASRLAGLRHVPGQREIDLLAPVEGRANRFFLPVVTAWTGASGNWTVGALVPLSALHEQYVLNVFRAGGGSGLYLQDGTGLARSEHAEQVRGKRVPEAIRLAARAASAPQGGFHTPGMEGRGLSVGFQRSERYPFIAASAQRDNVYLMPWKQRSWAKVAVYVVGLLALAWFAHRLDRLRTAMTSSEATYRRLFRDISDSVLLTTQGGEVTGLNPVAMRMLGVENEAQAVGVDIRAFYRVVDAFQVVDRPFARVRAGEQIRYGVTVLALRTGQQVDIDVRLSSVEVGGKRQLMYTVRDVSAERRHVRQQEHLANHDILTGLPNRHNLLRTLDQRIGTQPSERIDLVIMNLLRFREINEGFGPRAGDIVLEVCAQRLSKALAAMDWQLFRASGTEFVATAARAHSANGVQSLRERIFEVLREPVAVDGASVELHARMGSASFPDDALDSSQLLRCAEIAALQARRSVAKWVRYARALDQTPGRDLKLRADLTIALRTGQLRLFYQPKLQLKGRALVGAEALLRWKHPQRGWILPSEFIPLAESSELIHALTRWVLAEAVDRIDAWNKARRPLAVAVNVSANNLQDPDFVGYVKAIVERRAIAPQSLELEVTEGALAHNPEIVLRRLQELRDFGVGLALDDFGIGFSSLAYVRQFPFTSIKIDRSFVEAMLKSPKDRQVAKSTIVLGRELGLKTIAEGVENEQTVNELVALECDIGQGYLFGRPMPSDEFDQWRLGVARSPVVQAARVQTLFAG